MQINFEIFKKYIPIIIEGKFIISTPWQILFLKKPLLTRRKYRGKTHIYINNNILYKISTLSLQKEIEMQMLTRKCVKKFNIKVRIPKIKWWGKYKNFTIVAMQVAKGKKIINKPHLYKRIVEIENKLNKYNIFHNDWNRGNILHDEIKDKLWLLDFGEATSRQIKFINLTNFLV